MADDTPAVPTEPAPPPQAVHVMLDLETWGTGNDAVPVSLGACKFDDNEILDNFHVAIDPESAQALGLKIGAGTILWWFDPERDEARRRWLAMQRVDLASALAGFSEWLNAGTIITAIWGNGSTFDNVILRSAYAAAGLEYPVRFWQDACYRTIKQRTDIAIVREGTHHDALDDAISQAKHLQMIWRSQDDRPLREMLERCQQQFTFYSEQHRAKANPESQSFVGHTLRKQAEEKAAVNEALALDIRQLLDGGPVQA
jgi:hypothetical protein